MIAIDANLLLCAYNVSAPQHVRARAWLEESFSSIPLIGLPLVSVLAFLRVITDRRISNEALPPAKAKAIVNGWLSRENISILEPGARHWPIFFGTLADNGASGARITDVHLAALAIEHGATLYTNDRDFRAFQGLDVRFPLQAGS
jgi:toxin-antitoxin system PIN domain toxin